MIKIFVLFVCVGATAGKHEPWKTAMSELLDNKIIGGRRASAGEFPWAVSLRFNEPNYAPPVGHYCGGSVVTPTVVVTACHCATGWDPIAKKLLPFPVEDKAILAGAVKSDPTTKGGQLRNMEMMKMHPMCTKDPVIGRGFLYDYAYAIPDEPFTFNKRLQPIKLHRASYSEGRKYFKDLVSKKILCQASGFGYTTVEQGEYTGLSMELKAIGLNIISDKECKKLLCADHVAYCNISMTVKKDICAVSPTGGDVCKGDSGSSLVCEGEAVGILSWGPRCGEDPEEVVPSMYQRVDLSEEFLNFATAPPKLRASKQKYTARSSKNETISGTNICTPGFVILIPLVIYHKLAFKLYLR